MKRFIKKSFYKIFVSLFIIFYSFVPQVLAIDEVVDMLQDDNANQDVQDPPSEEIIVDEEVIVKEEIFEEPLQDSEVQENEAVIQTQLIETPSCLANSLNACVITDKLDYAPSEVALLTGYGYLPNTQYNLVIYSNDLPSIYFEKEILTDSLGSFNLSYQLDGIYRPLYFVEVHDLEKNILTSISFTDSPSWVCQNDVEGANDEPGQKDLTRMCADYDLLPSNLKVMWNWDEIGFSGGNTGDGCALFDTNDNGKANYALCVTINGSPASLSTSTLYSCNDKKADRCAGKIFLKTVNGGTDTHCTVDINTTDPFSVGSGYPQDTVAECSVLMSDISASEAQLLDICSYPSQEPNSDPSDCIIATNAKTGTLEIVKNVSPSDDLGIFNILVDGSVVAYDLGNGESTGEKVLLEGVHTFGEEGGTDTLLSLYQPSVTCLDVAGAPVPVTGSNPWSIQIDNRDDILCTITNTRNTLNLTVVKNVVNDNGGTKTAADFGITFSGGQLEIGSINTNEYTTTYTSKPIEVNVGSTYTLSEYNNIYGYESGTWDCGTVDTLNGAFTTITPINSNDIVCTITNNDIQPKLTVIKEVLGSTESADSFELFVDQTRVYNGVENGFNAGTYTVSETQNELYNSNISGDCASNGNITLSVGDEKECTVTNTRKIGNITFIKEFLTDTGDTSLWSFTVYDSLNNIVGIYNHNQSVSLPTGSYTVIETGPSSYFLENIEGSACSASRVNGVANLLVSENGGTCIFGNSEKASLTVTKIVDPSDSEDLFNFGLISDSLVLPLNTTLGHAQNFTFTDLMPGVYTLAESNSTGYFTSILCDDDISGQLGSKSISLTLTKGQDMHCTFTNTEYGSISVEKIVNWNGIVHNTLQTFDICIEGPSYSTPNCKQADFDGEILTWNNLLPGEYAISEVMPGTEWNTEISTSSVELLAGQDERVTVTNTRKLGNIEITKVVDWNGVSIDSEQEFEICIEGGTYIEPNCQTTDFDGGVLTWNNLIPGMYSVSETDPGTEWNTDIDSNTVVVPVDGNTGYSNITNTRVRRPSLSIEKSSTTSQLSAPSLVTYSYEVTNTGNVTLTGIYLSDDNDNNDMSCPKSTLAVFESMTCTATHTFTQKELDNGGSLDNLVTVYSDETDPVTDDLSIPILRNPLLSVQKSSLTTELSSPMVIEYSYLVTNSGNVTLTGISLTDDNDDDNMSCPKSTLAVLESMTCTATHTFTQEELDKGGSIYNEVSADSNETTPVTDDLTIPILQNPELEVIKSSSEEEINTVGEVVPYEFEISNTGNISLTEITISDPKCDSQPQYESGDDGDQILQISEVWIYSCNHTVTIEDIDIVNGYGDLNNIVEVDSMESDPDTDDYSIPIRSGKVTVKKSALPQGSDQKFDFNVDWSESVLSIADGEEFTSGWIVPGAYSVSEDLPSNWDLDQISCSEDELEDMRMSIENGVNLLVDAGDTITCEFTNIQRASVLVYKFEDSNGNGVWEEGEKFLSDWGINVEQIEGEEISQVTDEEGSTLFDLKTGEYILSEDLQDGWEQTGMYCVNSGPGVRITEYGEAYGHHGYCGGWNGCNDAATCAQWACEVNGYDKLVSYGEQRPCTEFNNCNLFNSRGSVQMNWGNWCGVMGVTDIMCGYSNESVLERVYQEVQMNEGGFSVNPGDSMTCYIGNIEKPELQISKSNDTNGIGKQIGDTVTYTLTISTPKDEDQGTYIVKDVKVMDILPEGFVFQADSWTSSLPTVSLFKPYSSNTPAVWSLGDMKEGEKVIITYKAKISLLQDPGLYKDIAYTIGYSVNADIEKRGDVLGVSSSNPSQRFVGTEVLVLEPKEIEEGEVLGAAIELPATGAETYITLGALISMILGIFLLIFNPKRKMKNLIVSGILILGIFTIFSAKPTSAFESTDIDVRMEQPQTPTKSNSFNIGYVALDLQDRNISVQCYKDDVAFGPVYTTNSGNCVIDSSVINTSGTYIFKVVVTAGAESKTSNMVTVQVVLEKPFPVTEYSKTEGTCSYTLKFKTANDGRTSKIQIFRSDTQPFTANSSTLIHELNVSPNTNIEYTDTPLPSCEKEYFYALRATDSLNNISDMVTDNIVTIVSKPSTGTTKTTVTVNGETGDIAGESTTDGVGGDDIPTNEDGEIAGEETSSDNQQDKENDQEDQTKEEDTKSFWDEYKYVILFLGVVVLGSVGYIYVKRRK